MHVHAYTHTLPYSRMCMCMVYVYVSYVTWMKLEADRVKEAFIEPTIKH